MTKSYNSYEVKRAVITGKINNDVYNGKIKHGSSSFNSIKEMSKHANITCVMCIKIANLI